MRNKVMKVIKKYANKTDTNHDVLMKEYKSLSADEKNKKFIQMKAYVDNQNI